MGHQIGSALHQSMQRVIVPLVNFLPGILALILALIVFTLLGVALSFVVRKLLIAVRFDERLSSQQTSGSATSITDWMPANSPTILIARAIVWLCVLVGVAVGLSAFDASYAENTGLASFLLPYLTHITGAVLILFLGSLAARFLARTVLIGAVNAQMQYARFLSLGLKWLVLVLTAAMALDHLQIGGGIVELAFGILFGGIVLTLALAIGLGSRDLVSRSIEKSIDRPFVAKPSEPVIVSESDVVPKSKIRHF